MNLELYRTRMGFAREGTLCSLQPSDLHPLEPLGC